MILSLASRPVAVAALLTCLTIVPLSAQDRYVSPDDPTVAAFADDFAAVADIRALIEDGDYAQSVPQLRVLAEAGNVWAQNLLGALYRDPRDGDAVPDDFDLGITWYERAAEQGFAPALHNLGVAYADPADMSAANYARAMDYLTQSADMGYVHSYATMARILMESDDFRDMGRSRSLIDEGRALAPDNQSLREVDAEHRYETGDFVTALVLFEALADEGVAYAQVAAGTMHYFAEGTDYDPDRARGYFEASAGQGNARAHAYLAEIWLDGYGVDPDPVRAYSHAVRSDAAGDAFGTYLLGVMQRSGRGTAQDATAALDTLQRALDGGDLDARTELADMAYFGEGQPVDYTKAYDLFVQQWADRPWDGYAAYSIAFMQMRGEGTQTDIAAARDILEGLMDDDSYDIATSRMELAVIYGHPDFAGPWSDPVRGMAHCIVLRGQGVLDSAAATDDAPMACAHLDATLDAGDLAAAAALAATF